MFFGPISKNGTLIENALAVPVDVEPCPAMDDRIVVANSADVMSCRAGRSPSVRLGVSGTSDLGAR
jgi:hypothetical protein